jgi:acyl-CoA synthetase (AMP-forming)/AMP-acid ligase II
MSGWNFADLFEALADHQPDEQAQRHLGAVTTWHDLDRRADGVAHALLEAGAVEQDKVAQYLYNGPEYLESVFAAFKAGLATVNTNYRYTADELVYLWDNADVVAVVFHGVFAPRCEEVRDRLLRIRTWLWVDDGSGPCPDWATPYEAAAANPPAERVQGPWGRSGDHLLLLYTGGTTGMPKGVMWRQDDLYRSLATSIGREPAEGVDLPGTLAGIVKAGPRNLAGAPLMHGTGLFNAMSNLIVGGSVITMAGRRFDVVELLDTIEESRASSVSIVGDPFAKPILQALEAEPGRWDLSSLRVMFSSGVMWSEDTKRGLLRHLPRLIMIDSLGSSEAIGMASSSTRAEGAAGTATFQLGPYGRVLTEDGRDVVPGSGETGKVALRGYTPIGYYKDAEKSAATFRVIDGVRYSVPGDFATVDADGTVHLLGRGSQCINTGGEKVFPEEVEECLKLHPTVLDAAVVGLPDDRFGEAIHALVEPRGGAAVDEAALIAHVKERLAGYKAPKRVLPVDTIGRAPNGKLDYRALKERATAATT